MPDLPPRATARRGFARAEGAEGAGGAGSAAASRSGPPLGRAFVDAIVQKDFAAVAALLHPEIDFRGLTPGRVWEASDPHGVISGVLRHWFEDSDHLEEALKVETDSFADRERVGYRLRGHNPDGPFVVEQQAYFSERDGRIGWMRVVCSGFRPL